MPWFRVTKTWDRVWAESIGDSYSAALPGHDDSANARALHEEAVMSRANDPGHPEYMYGVETDDDEKQTDVETMLGKSTVTMPALEELLANMPPVIKVGFTDDGPVLTDERGQRVMLVADDTAVMTTFHGGSFHVQRRVPQGSGVEVRQLGQST